MDDRRTSTDQSLRDEHAVQIQMDLDCWRPVVTAELLMPAEYGLAVHPDPWTLAWADPGQPLPRHHWWCVTDTVSGRPVSFARSRALAICTAFGRLQALAAEQQMTVAEVLADRRRCIAH